MFEDLTENKNITKKSKSGNNLHSDSTQLDAQYFWM